MTKVVSETRIMSIRIPRPRSFNNYGNNYRLKSLSWGTLPVLVLYTFTALAFPVQGPSAQKDDIMLTFYLKGALYLVNFWSKHTVGPTDRFKIITYNSLRRLDRWKNYTVQYPQHQKSKFYGVFLSPLRATSSAWTRPWWSKGRCTKAIKARFLWTLHTKPLLERVRSIKTLKYLL